MKKKLLNLCVTALFSVVCTAAWALSEEGGFYQIGSAADYAEFAALVNGGQKTINAILTADIDLGTDIDTYKVYVSGEYEGVFDGAGHTITINFADGTKDNQGPALFRSIGNKAIIKRLKVQGTLTTGRQHAAGIANYSGGVIRDCWADLNITCSQVMADASAGALVGQCNRHSVIENCLAKVAIDAPESHKFGGVAAWADDEQKTRNHFANNLVLNDNAVFDWSDGKSAGLVRNDKCLVSVDVATYSSDSYHNRPIGAVANNYVLDDWGSLNKGTTVVTPEEVASGKICYQLNSDQSQIRWKQNIGTDPYPVPAVFRETGQVYASAATNCQGKAEGAVTFSNTASNAIATPHTYKFGICTTCGQFNWNYFDFDNPTKFDLLDRSFIIKEASDFFVAEGWNRFHNGLKFNLKLANDVTCKPESGQVIFNTNDWMESSFYGQNHTLTIEMVDITEDYAALFPKWYSSGKVIENLTLHGTIGTSARNAGSLIGRDYGTDNRIRNVFSDVTINTTHTGDCSHGGFMNCGGTRTTFDNCIYAGDINGVEGSEAVGGFCGWGNATNYYNNCAFLGSINNISGDTHTISRNPGQANSNNVYSVFEYNGTDAGKYTPVIPEAVGSGELAYKLNGEQEGVERFYQLIGKDPMPTPIAKEGALVYTKASEYRCDGTPMGDITYANTPSAVVPAHQFEEGFCTVCGEMDENFMTPAADGWYEVGTPAQLMWWAHYAAKKNLGASVRLTADIDMEEYATNYPERSYPQIGTESAPFYGNFDGQFHTISCLEIYLPGKRGAGLIGVMSSQPSNGFGGLSAEDARAAEGVFVKNVVLDKNCSICGQGYTGVVGMAANWPGHITISGVLNMGDATVDGGTNGAGLFGCAMGSACHMTITNCGFTGNVHVLNDTHTENGLFSGWLGQYVEVTNCFALGKIDAYPDPNRSWARHPNYNTVVITNCYAQEGTGIVENSYSDNTPEVTFVPEEEVVSGALAWKANGNQFRNPAWFQTLGEDAAPTPIPTHGVVIYGAEQYFSAVKDEDIEDIALEIQRYEEGKAAEEDIIATQSLLDDKDVAIEALTGEDAMTIAGFTTAYYALEDIKADIAENAAVYQAYMDKCDEIRNFLNENKDFSGRLRDALEYYLSDEVSEPDDFNLLGTYEYIIDNHTATAEQIAEETARVAQWLQDAIAEDYQPGADVSKLIPNSDFAEKNAEHWTGAWCNAYGNVASSDEQLNKTVGVEAWNRTGDMFQTVEGMKPGYYLVGINGAFRPSNNRYSTNYAAGIYANGVFNYFPAAVEDYIAAKDTIDQVNCNLHGEGASDLDVAIYDDNFSTSQAQADDRGASLLGYAVHGPVGMAAAANALRYPAYTIAKVGEDGQLTIGIKNPGTKYGNDWTGWSAIKVTYCGDDESWCSNSLDVVLANMKARAKTILDFDYEYGLDMEHPAAAPNFPQALKEALQAAVAKSAETVAEKAALAAEFSDIFQRIYEGKQAYIALYNYALNFTSINEKGNLALVEKSNGVWTKTGSNIFSDQEMDAIYVAQTSMIDAYLKGTYSTEEAQNPALVLDAAAVAALAEIVPEQDEEGYYLLSSPKNVAAFRYICNERDNTAKAKLTADIDMTGVAMEPIGNKDVIWTSGVLDGQGHTLSNVFVSTEFMKNKANNAPATLFYELKGATVKNLKLTGEYHSDQKFMAGLTRWMSEGSTVDNCEIAVALYCGINGDNTAGGIVGVTADTNLINHCLVNCKFISEEGVTANSIGGVCGWKGGTLNIKNTLITSNYDGVSAEGSHSVSRNGCTMDNVWVATTIGGEGESLYATSEKLLSGEVCYKLNGDQTDVRWYQTLGEDEHPMLFGDHKRVWFANGVYSNNRLGDVNGDFAVDIADVVKVLSFMAESATAEEHPEADVNGDKAIDIADVVKVLSIMAEQ